MTVNDIVMEATKQLGIDASQQLVFFMLFLLVIKH